MIFKAPNQTFWRNTAFLKLQENSSFKTYLLRNITDSIKYETELDQLISTNMISSFCSLLEPVGKKLVSLGRWAFWYMLLSPVFLSQVGLLTWYVRLQTPKYIDFQNLLVNQANIEQSYMEQRNEEEEEISSKSESKSWLSFMIRFMMNFLRLPSSNKKHSIFQKSQNQNQILHNINHFIFQLTA